MANVLNGNTWFVDTAFNTEADDLARKGALVVYVVVTTTGANGRIVFGDAGNNPTPKLDIRIPAANSSQMFAFELKAMLFPNGIRVLTLSNAVATVEIQNPGG